MSTVTLDFETYYDRAYTLSKLTYAEYLNDDQFEVIGVAAKIDDQPTTECFGTFNEICQYLNSLDLDQHVVICHNAHFDGAILETVFGIRPKAYFCTMMAARALVRPFTERGSVSLAKVTEYFGLGTKGTEVLNAIGMHKADFTPEQLAAYIKYCINDVNLTYMAYQLMGPDLPKDEHDLINLTITKYTRPQFVLDKQICEDRLTIHQAEKAQLLANCGVTDPSTLRSNPKFADMLLTLGIDPPVKISPRTGKQTYAFAKTDAGMQNLAKHNDPMVRALIEARLGHKSSIEETRIQRFITLADMPGGMLPVALLYYGAHTGRYSGTQMINLQGLTNGSVLRKALCAPDGYKVLAGDLSQIEARITVVLAGEQHLIDQFMRGEDVYSNFATVLYGYPVSKTNSPNNERFVGKTCILGFGYGLGHAKFFETMAVNPLVNIDIREAKRTVDVYRSTYPQIPKLWRKMDGLIKAMAAGTKVTLGPVYTMKNAIVLPNGMKIRYPNLRQSVDGWVYDSPHTPGGQKKLYGGALTENIVQALARIILSYAELSLARRGIMAALQVHDELVYIVKNENVDIITKALTLVLNAPVTWMPNLPVESEIKNGQTYYDAK